MRDPRVITGALALLVAAAAATGAAARTAAPAAGPNLIVNRGAEQGTPSADGYTTVEIPGWNRKGEFTVVAYGTSGGFPDATVQKATKGGKHFFAGGPTNPHSALSQDIDVSGKRGLVDRGKLKATLSGYLGGFASQNDSLLATAIFLSQSGKKLGSARIGPVGAKARNFATGMLKKSITKPIPKSTRTIRVVLAANRTAGSYNDGYADNLSLTVGR